MTAATWIVLGVLALPTAEPTPQRPTYSAYSRAGDAAMKGEALAKTAEQKAPFVAELCRLYAQLRADERVEQIEEFAALHTKWNVRLRRVAEQQRRELARKQPATSPAVSASEAVLSAAEPVKAGGGNVPDHGQLLVDLIQRVIAADQWDVHGGRSSIVYYAPLKVLVVSAPGEVHADLGGLLNGVRAAGN